MMEKRISKKRRKPISPIKILIYIVLILLVLIYILPLLWMVLVSLKTNQEVLT